MTNLAKAIFKIDEFIADCLQVGWTVKGYHYTRIRGVEKYGVDVQTDKGEILQFNQEV